MENLTPVAEGYTRVFAPGSTTVYVDVADEEYETLYSDKPPPGYVRRYEDHTGRWYKDLTEAENAAEIEAFKNDPLCQILQEEIQKEINAEIMRALRG